MYKNMKFSTLMGGNRVPKEAGKSAENCTDLRLARKKEKQRKQLKRFEQILAHTHTNTFARRAMAAASGIQAFFFFWKGKASQAFC